VEEAWELAVVSEGIHDDVKGSVRLDYLFRSFRRKKLVRAAIAAYISMFGIMLAVMGDNTSLKYAFSNFFYDSGASVTKPEFLWFRLLGILIAIISSIYFVRYYFNAIQTSASSPAELATDQTTYEIRNLRREIGKLKNNDGNLTLIENKIQEILDNKKEAYQVTANSHDATDWKRIIFIGRERLLLETSRLSARSRLNLTWGVILSSVAIGYLTLIIFFGKEISEQFNVYNLAWYYAPRLSLILIIQILASFFLRMYVGNERDILKNKNEITNLELRIAAGLLVKSPAHQAKLAERLIVEERNFVLNKKEKAVPPDGMKETSEILKQLQILIKSLKP
jgi:hypothetical protein